MKLITLLTTILLTSCAVQNKSVVREPSKDGSIETVIAISHFKGYDLLTTTYKVWINNTIDKVITKSDTLKPLGNITKRVDDGWGGEKTRTFPKAYEVYITVK